jgi:hypothetical protein
MSAAYRACRRHQKLVQGPRSAACFVDSDEHTIVWYDAVALNKRLQLTESLQAQTHTHTHNERERENSRRDDDGDNDMKDITDRRLRSLLITAS